MNEKKLADFIHDCCVYQNPPAKAESILRLENSIQQQLPLEIASFLRIADGCSLRFADNVLKNHPDLFSPYHFYSIDWIENRFFQRIKDEKESLYMFCDVFLAFGDCHGPELLIGIKGEYTGMIYAIVTDYYDGNDYTSMLIKIADSFEKMIDMLMLEGYSPTAKKTLRRGVEG